MSKYTTEVRYICEKAAGLDESMGYGDIENIISQSRSKIFDFEYPIFDDEYKSVIETKILRHYYTREIGLETVGLWKHFLNMRMNEIMPYYNKLYNSELIEFNPLYNVKYDTSHQGVNAGTSSGANDGTTTDTKNLTETYASQRDVDESIHRETSGRDETEYGEGVLDKFSDTPQGAVSNLLNDTYLTNAKSSDTDGQSATDTASEDDTDRELNDDLQSNRRNTGTDTVESHSTNSSNFRNTDDYLRHVEGYNGGRSFSELITEFRKTFLNIDMMVIRELNDLFMGVW